MLITQTKQKKDIILKCQLEFLRLFRNCSLGQFGIHLCFDNKDTVHFQQLRGGSNKSLNQELGVSKAI